MSSHNDNIHIKKTQAALSSDSQNQIGKDQSASFLDNRPETIFQRKLQENANNSSQASQLSSFQNLFNTSQQSSKLIQLQAKADQSKKVTDLDISSKEEESEEGESKEESELKKAKDKSDEARNKTSEAVIYRRRNILLKEGYKESDIKLILDEVENGEEFTEVKKNFQPTKNALPTIPVEESSLFANAAGEVILKLKEHKKVINLIKNLDSTTNISRAIFWSGHELIFDDETKVLQMKNDAMLMAQKLARDVGSKTLEMTDAGYALDKLAPFQELKDRFKFMYNLDGLDKALFDEIGAKEGVEAQKQIQNSIEEKKKTIKTLLNDILINQFNDAGLKLSEEQKANLGNAGTGAAGTMWNIISHKFSESVSGEVSAVHGVKYSFTKDDNKPDAKNPSPKEIWEKGTWMKTEKKAAESKLGIGPGKVKSIVNFFTDILFVTWDNKETNEFNNLKDYREAYFERYKEVSKLIERPVEVAPNEERFLQTQSEFKDGEYEKSALQEFSQKVDTVKGYIVEYVNNFFE